MSCSHSSSMLLLKAQSRAREESERRQRERRKSILALIAQYLLENGFIQSSCTLQQEAASYLSKMEVADNVDLNYIFQEFETSFEQKCGRRPRLTRRITDGEFISSASQIVPAANGSSNSSRRAAIAPSTRRHREGCTPAAQASASTCGLEGSLSIQGVVSQSKHGLSEGTPDLAGGFCPPALGPLPQHIRDDADLRALATTIMTQIVQTDPAVSWESIVGLDDARSVLQETILMPLQFPTLFQGLLSPCSGSLLYGPPGTGKTLLARGLVSRCRTTFFSISASCIVSKYRGDSEKLVRLLFDLARHFAPSTIFLDEVDALMSHRGGAGEGTGSGEHEGSLRMKTELLIQMDGLCSQSTSSAPVFVLGATNMPWNLDQAFIRRLEKRIYIPMPDKAARQAMLKLALSYGVRMAEDVQLDTIAERTEGYSGADIRLLCREAAMRPVRRIIGALSTMPAAGVAGRAKSSGEAGSQTELAPITMEDLLEALRVTPSSVRMEEDKYKKWDATYRFG